MRKHRCCAHRTGLVGPRQVGAGPAAQYLAAYTDQVCLAQGRTCPVAEIPCAGYQFACLRRVSVDAPVTQAFDPGVQVARTSVTWAPGLVSNPCDRDCIARLAKGTQWQSKRIEKVRIGSCGRRNKHAEQRKTLAAQVTIRLWRQGAILKERNKESGFGPMPCCTHARNRKEASASPLLQRLSACKQYRLAGHVGVRGLSRKLRSATTRSRHHPTAGPRDAAAALATALISSEGKAESV